MTISEVYFSYCSTKLYWSSYTKLKTGTWSSHYEYCSSYFYLFIHLYFLKFTSLMWCNFILSEQLTFQLGRKRVDKCKNLFLVSIDDFYSFCFKIYPCSFQGFDLVLQSFCRRVSKVKHKSASSIRISLTLVAKLLP